MPDKRVRLSRIEAALARLGNVGEDRAGQLLGAFFVLKRNNVNERVPTVIEKGAFQQLGEDFYFIRGALDPQRPYFDPLYAEWKNVNWPAGSWVSRLQDTTPIQKKGFLAITNEDGHRTYQLKAGYVGVLADYVNADKKIPLSDFLAWIYRYKPVPDDGSIADLKGEFRAQLHLSDEEFGALFQDLEVPEDGDFFAPDDWPAEALLEILPRPTVQADQPQEEAREAGESIPPLPEHDDLVALIVRQMREAGQFEVDPELVGNVLITLQTERFVVLVGKAGSGKTEFVRRFLEALRDVVATRGIVVAPTLEVPVKEDFAEFDLVGYRDLAGDFVSSPLVAALRDQDADDNGIHPVLLDEANLAGLDEYGAGFIEAVRRNPSRPLTLPGKGGGQWSPPRGTYLFATLNSYLEDPSRKALSQPIKRRTQVIPMPDRIEQLVQRGDKNEFVAFCKLLLRQRAEDLARAGSDVLSQAVPTRLRVEEPTAAAIDLLWAICTRTKDNPEIAITAGVVQSILEYLTISGTTDASLDRELVQKLLPLLRGPIEVLDRLAGGLDEVLGADWATRLPNTASSVGRMMALASENRDRIRPLF